MPDLLQSPKWQWSPQLWDEPDNALLEGCLRTCLYCRVICLAVTMCWLVVQSWWAPVLLSKIACLPGPVAEVPAHCMRGGTDQLRSTCAPHGALPAPFNSTAAELRQHDAMMCLQYTQLLHCRQRPGEVIYTVLLATAVLAPPQHPCFAQSGAGWAVPRHEHKVAPHYINLKYAYGGTGRMTARSCTCMCLQAPLVPAGRDP